MKVLSRVRSLMACGLFVPRSLPGHSSIESSRSSTIPLMMCALAKIAPSLKASALCSFSSRWFLAFKSSFSFENRNSMSFFIRIWKLWFENIYNENAIDSGCILLLCPHFWNVAIHLFVFRISILRCQFVNSFLGTFRLCIHFDEFTFQRFNLTL